MKTTINFIFGGLFMLALILTAYYFDLTFTAIHTPEIVKVLPCYQNPIGRLAVKTLNHINR